MNNPKPSLAISTTLLMLLILLPVMAIAQQAPDSIKYTGKVEEVVVVGLRPGPELWKVSKGDNVLWILGTHSPLPKKMKWQSSLVEAVIEDSQALLYPPNAKAEIGFFKRFSLLTAFIGVRKNPDGKRLNEVIPEPLYERWLALKQLYIGKSRKVEKYRPLFAAFKLFDEALDDNDLVFDAGVEKKVRKLAKRHKLENIKPMISVAIEDPKGAIKQFKKSEIDDLACFTATIERLEEDLPAMRMRANAWANGHITKLKSLNNPEQEVACGDAILNSGIASETGLKAIPERLRDAWVEAATQALRTNPSTFAYLPMSNLLGRYDYLAALQALGYVIEAPK